MNDSNFFTDGTGIYKFERFETVKVAVLKNLESGIIAKVPWQENGKLKGFRRVGLRQPDEAVSNNRGRTNALKDSSAPAIENRQSKYKGVSWNKRQRKWRVQVLVGGKLKYGGSFDDEIEAAKRAGQMRVEAGKPKVNFP